jgi:hypothetical protein
MSFSSQLTRCPNCGGLLVADSGQSACPLCLLEVALSDSPENEVRDEAPWFELPNDLPRSGEVIGHYRLLEEIARGGMGIIYRALQEGSQRIVALKMILPHQQSTPEMIARFQAEREIVASLDHPNILPIYENRRGGRHPVLHDEIGRERLADRLCQETPGTNTRHRSVHEQGGGGGSLRPPTRGPPSRLETSEYSAGPEL